MATELTPKQQWSEQIKTAKSILIVTHQNPDGDALGSSLALKLSLEKLGKQVSVAAIGKMSAALSFLPQFKAMQPSLHLNKDLLVVLDESQAKIGNVSLKRISENKLIVVITPKDGTLTPANVRIEEGSFNVDLVIVLDCADLERLGSLHEENSSLFYEIPVINIDHHPSNTNFGTVNIVDVTASSTAEILVSLLETLAKDMPTILDADIATCLLTGVISDTGSFQNGNTTPKSLTVAAQLVAAGGRQQEIIQHIFKERSLSTLRLWGRALSYIKEDQPLKFAWSILSKSDFVASQSSPEEAKGVIDELLKTAIGMDFVLLLTEREGAIHGSFRSVKSTTDVSKLATLFGGGGHPQAAAFTIPNSTLAQKEMEIIKQIRSFLNPTPPPSSDSRDSLPKQGQLPTQASPLPAVIPAKEVLTTSSSTSSLTTTSLKASSELNSSTQSFPLTDESQNLFKEDKSQLTQDPKHYTI